MVRDGAVIPFHDAPGVTAKWTLKRVQGDDRDEEGLAMPDCQTFA